MNDKQNVSDENAYATPSIVSETPKKKRRSTAADVFALVGLVCVLIFMLLPTVGSERGPAKRTVCLNNLRQIALAMINYESANGHFPPAYIADENGKPMHSWRVLILPFIEEKELFDRYSMDEPWDGPNNSKLHGEFVPLYRCSNSSSKDQYTDYVLVTGKGTGFNADQTISYSDITDGSSNTVMATEVADAEFHWMKPQDISVDQFLDTTRKSSTTNHPGTRSASLFDGSTHSIGTDVPSAELRKSVLIADGEEVNILDW